MNLKKILSVLSRLRRQALDALSAAGPPTTDHRNRPGSMIRENSQA
jgi:hypothetical protein